MNALSEQSAQPSGVLRHLSNVTQISVHEVERIYAGEVHRLAAEARIQTFVAVLALGRTRDVLRRIKHTRPRP